MIRRILFAAALALPVAALAAPAPVTGRWVTEDKAALVEIGRCGETICGRIARVLKDDPRYSTTDVNNPDRAKRSRPIVGLPVLTGFTPDDDVWRGRIYDPREGKDYRSVLTRQGNNRLKVQGCLGPFCKTQIWTRAG